MPVSDDQKLAMWREVLQLCRIKPGQNVAVLTGETSLAANIDMAAFGIAHVGWGLHPKANWGALGMRDKVQSYGMDSRSFAGNFLFSTGPNAEAGGSNHSPCHIDIPMADCSVSLDGERMTVDGVLVAADQRLPV